MLFSPVSSSATCSLVIFALIIAAQPTTTTARGLTQTTNVKYPDNVVLIAIGGYEFSSVDEVDIISISNNTHTRGAPSPEGIYDFGSAMINNTIYTVSGTKTQTTFAYDVKANQWTTVTDTFPDRAGGNTVAATSTNKLIAMGGDGLHFGVMNQVYEYDLNDGTNGKWNQIGTLNDYFYDACAVSVGNSIYLILDKHMLRSDDEAKTWKEVSSYAWNQRFNAACLMTPDQKEIMMIGGNGDYASSVDVFNIEAGNWRKLASLNNGRASAGAVIIPDGKNGIAIICGGSPNGLVDNRRDDCEVYDWSKNEWKIAEFKLDMPRFMFALFAVNTTAA